MTTALSRRASDDLGSLAFSWLEQEGGGRLLIDDSLHVRWANATARKWLAERHPISLVDGHLCLARATPLLKALLERAQSGPEGTCLPIPNCGLHLILCARMLGIDGDKPIFGLSLRRTDDDGFAIPHGVLEVFDMTGAEQRVLHHLVGGDTAQDAARKLGLSVETVRTHIKRLYQKVGVNSREALMSQLRPFMLSC